MKALVVGYGSIGGRHCRVLSELQCEVSVVSHRQHPCMFPKYCSLKEGLYAVNPDYVVVANRTHEHFETLFALREYGYQGVVLLEKPLFDHPRVTTEIDLQNVFVAYNLRFHPVLQRLKSFISLESVVSAQIYVGQYLPHWRLGDYRTRYSAKHAEGGGVLRDLSHELDYAQWLLGQWQKVTALGGHYSALDIDSDDVFALLMTTNQCPIINIQMNYLDRLGRREIIMNTNEHTYMADLVHNTLQIDDEIETWSCEADTTYRLQHLEVITRQFNHLCTAEQALETMHLIQQAEEGATSERWNKR